MARWIGRQTDGQMDEYTDRWIYIRWIARYMSMDMGRQEGGQIDGQTAR
jgi:hypothetical protein